MGDVEVAALGGGGDEAMGASDSAAEAPVTDDGMVTTFFLCFFRGVVSANVPSVLAIGPR